jgi:hypothetical protein
MQETPTLREYGGPFDSGIFRVDLVMEGVFRGKGDGRYVDWVVSREVVFLEGWRADERPVAK